MVNADPDQPQLLKTSGSLMIDVFKRANYTTDANALAVEVFGELGRMYAFLNNTEEASVYRAAAANITAALNSRLWRGDHFATQLNPDGTETDFVDYDSNLLATAFVPMSVERLEAVLQVRAFWLQYQIHGFLLKMVVCSVLTTVRALTLRRGHTLARNCTYSGEYEYIV